MRGYVATVVGGLSGMYVTAGVVYAVLVEMFGDRATAPASGWADTLGSILGPFPWLLIVLPAAAVLGTVGLAAAAAVRVARAGAALETGSLAAAMVPLEFALLPALPPLARAVSRDLPDDWWIVGIPATAIPLFILARWLGVRWSRHRGGAAPAR
jgi:hypothetical protein